MRIDRSRKRLELMSVAACDPETDNCVVECDPGADLCDSGTTYVDEALDAGQTILGDVTESSGECPAEMVGGAWFRWRAHDFVVWGTFTRQLSIRSWPWGEAEYALPPGPHESMDNKATIWNGVLKAKCFGYADSRGGFSGIINWTWLRGNAEEASTPGGGSGGDEASYYDISNGTLVIGNGHVSTGDDEVDAVVNNWLDTGECTDGWVIVVDGVRVC